jgi:hypothetical protein
MPLDDIKSVLSFAAFKPTPDDAETSWGERFTGRRSVLMNVNRSSTTWRALNKKGRLQELGTQDGEFAEVATARAEEWQSTTDGGWVAVSLNNRFIISLETNLSRRDNFNEMLRVNPKVVLGSKYDRGKRYALFHHPDSSASILMAIDDSFVKNVEDSLRASGLKAGRICCGLFALMEEKLRMIHEKNMADANGNYLLIACVEGSVAAIVQQAKQWKDMRCRCGVGTDNMEATFQIIAPLVTKLTPGTPVYFVHDGNDANYARQMMEELEKVGGKDISTEDQLWKTIGQS